MTDARTVKKRCAKKRRALVLAALTDPITGDPKPWLAAEEIGYSQFVADLSLREIVAALQGLRQIGIVEHSGGCEWRLTAFGLEKTRTGIWDAMKRTPLSSSSKPLKRTAPNPRRRPVSPASLEQRGKVRDAECRSCGSFRVQPAHVVDRSLGGCDSAACVIPLCFACHGEYDAHALDCLPLLERHEQAHAVEHLGLVGALERTTGESWAPMRRAAA